MKNINKIISILILITVFFSCEEESQKIISEIANIDIDKNCSFWLEGDNSNSMLRAGIAGSCDRLTLENYANSLDDAFSHLSRHNVNKKTIKLIYLNIHEGSNPFSNNLIRSINSTKLGDDECSDFKTDKCFIIFNQKSNYIRLIDKVIDKHFEGQFNVSFKGVKCIERDELVNSFNINRSILLNSCYPLSFGLAVYKR